MNAALKVLSPGLRTTIQDGGRRGYRRFGVPVSGALDRDGLALANALVGNDPATAGIEVLVLGPTLELLGEGARIAAVGAHLVIGERPLPAGQSGRLVRGSRLLVKPDGGLVSYLAVEGGFDLPPVLGSLSTYAQGGFGGLDGRALAEGDLLPLRGENAPERPEMRLAAEHETHAGQPIRVVLGPQDDYFSEAAIDTFLSATYRISPQADRMGFRLDGPKLEHSKGSNIVSDGTVEGSVQVPGSGLPIVLLADAQTTGGYPKIATVISADVPLLARRPPGSTVRFAAVSQQHAEAICREHAASLAAAIAAIRPLTAAPVPAGEALYSANLVSGVASALD
jgi:biotin-dependent carboxylase-like uncharacterized protein